MEHKEEYQTKYRILTIGETIAGKTFSLPPETITETFAILAKG